MFTVQIVAEPAEIANDEFAYGPDDPTQRIRFVDLHNLINLKLVCYKDLPAARMQDLIDVRRLVEANALDQDFVRHLHPSVHDLFRQALKLNQEEQEINRRREQ